MSSSTEFRNFPTASEVLDIEYASRHGFKRGFSGLGSAARRTRRFESEARLRKRGVDPKTGRSVLHEAAKRGSVGVVEHLIASKLDPNAKDKKGNTPLHLAAAAGDLTTVRALLSGNADKEIKNKKEETPEQVARARGWHAVARQLSTWTSAWDNLKEMNEMYDKELQKWPRKIDDSPAVARAKKLLKCKEAAHGTDSARLVITLSRLSELYVKEERFGEAIQSLKRALRLTLGEHGEDHPDARALTNNMGEVYYRWGKLELAAASYGNAIKMYEIYAGNESMEVARILEDGARVHSDLGNHSASDRMLTRAAVIVEARMQDSDHPGLVKLLLAGASQLALGCHERALLTLSRALAIADKHLGPHHLDIATH